MGAEKLFKVGFILSATDKMSRVIDQAVGKSMKSLSAFERNASKAGKSVMQAGAIMTGAGAAVGAAALGIAKSSADYAGLVKDMSEATGIDAENWQKMTYAAKIAGIEKEKLMTSMVKFDKTIAEAAKGSEKAALLFKDFGISIQDAAGNLRAAEEVFQDVAEAFGDLEDNAVVPNFFGKTGAELMPLLTEGKEGLEGLCKAAEESGNVLSGSAVTALYNFGKNLEYAETQVNGLQLRIVNALVPMLDGLLKKVTDVIENVTKWTNVNPKLLQTISKAASGLSALLIGAGSAAILIGSIVFITDRLATIFGKAKKAVLSCKDAFTAAKNSMLMFRVQYAALIVYQKLAAEAQWLVNKALIGYTLIQVFATILTKSFNKVLKANPILGIISLIIELGTAVDFVINHWDKIKKFFAKLWEHVKEIFSKAWEDIKKFFNSLWVGVKDICSEAWEGIKSVFLNYTPAGLVIKHWDKITGFFGRLWDGVKSGVSNGWEAIKAVFLNYTPAGLVIKHWDKITGFFGRLWDGVKYGASNGWEAIKAVFLNYTPAGLVIKHRDKITGFFGRLWDGVKSGVSNGWEAIKNLFFNYTPLGILINHWQGLPQIFSNLWNSVKEVTIHVWDSIGEFFSGLGKRFFEWGKSLITSLWDGIKSVVNTIIEKVKAIGGMIAGGFKAVLGIDSPSKVFMEYGLNITQGLTNGLDRGTPDVEKSAGGVASRVLEGAAQSNVSGGVYNSYAAGGGSVNLNYSPNITINGNMSQDEKQDFAKMLRDNADEIMQMFEQWQRNKVRLSFLQ